jgi:arylsulfatase A-like enzyme
MQDLYDSDVRFCSRQIERLFEQLRELGIWDDIGVIFSSDHGEEFGEHGRFYHRNYPYEELTHVPLVVKPPAVEDAPDRVDATRELVDLLPTICAFHDVAPEGTFEGEHLYEGDSRRAFSLGQPTDASAAVALRTDGWTYITNDETTQLYDRASDRHELHDLAAERPDVVDRLDGQIPPRLRTRDVNAPRAPDDEVDREHLEALGYMELRE